MKELLLLVAAMTPKELLVDRLEQSIQDYKNTPSALESEREEKYQKIQFNCMVLNAKEVVDTEPLGKIMEDMADVKEFMKIRDSILKETKKATGGEGN